MGPGDVSQLDMAEAALKQFEAIFEKECWIQFLICCSSPLLPCSFDKSLSVEDFF